MLKNLKIIFLLFIFILSAFSMPAKSLAANQVLGFGYNIVVKIYTYYEDADKNLKIAKEGFGIIVDSGGKILTNESIVTVKDDLGNEVATAYKICVTNNTPFDEPECQYAADLLSKEKGTDLALLKINNFGFGKDTTFNYATFSVRKAEKGSKVYAYGFPAMAGDTIFGLPGKIVDISQKNGSTWFSNDVLSIFGNYGGALFNGSSEIVGMTTKFSPVLGDALSSEYLKDFVFKSALKTPQISSIEKDFEKFFSKAKNLISSKKFNNDKPSIELSKNSIFDQDVDWIFKFKESNSVSLYKQSAEAIKEQIMTFNTKITANLWDPNSIKKLKHSILPDLIENLSDKLLFSNNVIKQDQDLIDKPIDNLFNQTGFSQKILDALSKVESGRSRNSTITSADKVDVSSYLDEKAGFLNIKWLPTSVLVDDSVLQRVVKDLERNIACVNKGKIIIAGREGYKIECPTTVANVQEALVGSDNYLFILTYSYGDKNLYKSKIDGFLKSLVIKDQGFKPEASKVALPVISQAENDVNKNQNTIDATESVKKKNLSSVTKSSISKVRIIKNLGKRFIGRILLQVQSRGEAWYVSPKTNQAHYLANGEAAYQLMREQGAGISNKNLAKIPVGLSKVSGEDSDQDGLSDPLEQALGTNKNKSDSDGDGYNDKDEIASGTNFLGKGSASYNVSFANRQKGKILLQVESRGEAWYVNPKDGKRYFLGKADDAYNIMREQGLGISEKDFNNL